MNVLLTLTLLASLPAQPARPLPGDAAIDRFLAADAAEVSKNFLAGHATLAKWQAAVPKLRRQYLDMLGLWPLSEKSPLKAKVTGTLSRGNVVIEKLHYQSRPGLYVTANLYRPADTKKHPAILYVCGHSGRGRDGNKTAFQDHGMWFARHGYVCLIVDTLQLGEVAGVHHGTYNLGRWWWQARGYTPAGVECYNGIRGIDYLVSRPEVDPDRIGVTGISGGGAATIWVAAADERVKVAVPVSGMSDLESYVSHKVVNGHCDCMFLYNTRRWEWTTIAALIAPRPLLFVNSDNDPIFPMDGNRRIIARLRQAYKMHGKPGLVDDHVSKGGHDYRRDLRLAVFRWFDRHLMGVKREIEDAGDTALPGKQLRVFAEDADLPRDAINARVDETFVPLGRPGLPEEGAFPRWQKSLLEKLRVRVFHTLAARAALPDASTRALVSAPVQEGKGGRPGMVVILGESDEPGKSVPDWARPHVGSAEVALLRLRGTGPTRWTRKSPPNYVERAHALVGRTVDGDRVQDVASIARWQSERAGRGVCVVGRGPAGVLAAYAALFEPGIARVIVVDPPASHRQGPYLLGVQRVLDVPDALGLLAPRPLTLVGAKDRAFDTTAEIYRRAGAANQFSRVELGRLAGSFIVAAADTDDAVLTFFLRRDGNKKARALVLTAGKEAGVARRLRKLARASGEASVEVRSVTATDDGSVPDFSEFDRVWIAGDDTPRLRQAVVGTTVERGLRAVFARGGIVAASGPAVAILTKAPLEGKAGGCDLLPGAVVELAADKPSKLPGALKANPGCVGFRIEPGGALAVSKTLLPLGKGKVTAVLAAGAGRPERRIDLKGWIDGFNSLRRDASQRAVPEGRRLPGSGKKAAEPR